MPTWLEQHGLELVLAVLGGAWFLSRFFVSVGEWKRGVEPPLSSLTEKRLQQELDAIAHRARNLILSDLQSTVQRFEKKMDEGHAKSSDQWARVQAKIGEIEIALAVLRTKVDDQLTNERRS